MAEINNSGVPRKRKAGVTRMKKATTRVDLTPMVDLGFLLITFFIFTTSMTKPKASRLVMPQDSPDKMPVKNGGVLTLIPAGNGTVYYYPEQLRRDHSNLMKTTIKDIRQVIISKKQHTPPKDFFVIIKPAETSAYQDFMDVLDEMIINDVQRYALVEMSAEEHNLIAK